MREEVEAGLGEPHPPFSLQPLVEMRLQRVKVADIGGGIILLRVGEFRRAPIGRLLLFGNFLLRL